jgi:hypothetical protein
VLEVTTNIGTRRTWRAELVMAPREPRGLIAEDVRQAPGGFALGVGDWS